MDPFQMVVMIVLIATIGKVVSARYKAKHGIIEDKDMNGNVQQRLASDPDTKRLHTEISQLKDRIQVLERIATDNNSANDLNRQIEELRGR
jgi:cell fate (sporulation/competence/biofilm development) regulator YlbF (YheA/YmcA/DUF963 family)